MTDESSGNTMDKDIDLSVIVVGYKNEEITLDCFKSIRAQNDIGDRLEVILVDNSPTHNVHDAVVKAHPWVIGIKNENNGFGAGNNVGARRARGQYLLFLNPDTILIEPVFEFAMKKFSEAPDLAMFGVKMVSKELAPNASFYFLESGGFFRSLAVKVCNALDIYVDGYMYVAGADMFVRREDFFRCGQFDEAIFMYYEEPDLTLRLHKLGTRTAYFKDRRIIHLEGGTTGDNEIALRRRLDSAIYFYNKIGKSAMNMFRRELRLCRIKGVVYRVLRHPQAATINKKIRILEEYLQRTRCS